MSNKLNVSWVEKYQNIFYVKNAWEYNQFLKYNSKNLKVTKYEKNLDDFFSFENKRSFNNYLKKIRSEMEKLDEKERMNFLYIIEIHEKFNQEINSIEKIVKIDYYSKKLSKKLKKVDNLFLFIVNDNIIVEKSTTENEAKKIVDEKMIEDMVNEKLEQKERELKSKIQEELFAEKEKINLEKQEIEKLKENIELEKNRLAEEEKKIEKWNNQHQIKEEIEVLSKSINEESISYEFDYDTNKNISIPKNSNAFGSEYDSIVWMNDKNKNLFNIKKSRTKSISLNDVESSLDKLIDENSNIAEIRLETNQVKIDDEIDFDEVDLDMDAYKKKKTIKNQYIPYQKK